MHDYNTAEGLMAKAYELLSQDDYQGALIVASRLKAMSHSSYFEVAAKASAGMGEIEHAIGILREGVAAAPQVYALWELLGTMLSDVRRFNEAIDAYEEARKVDEFYSDAVDLNLAIVYERMRDYDKAWELLDHIPPYSERPPAWRVDLVKLGVLNGMKKYADTLELSQNLVKRIPSEEKAFRAVGHADRAAAYWLGFRDAEDALEEAWTAIGLDKTNAGASWIIRDIEGSKTKSGKPYKVVVSGRWYDEPRGFYTTYHLVAENEKDALDLIRAYEPEGLRPSLQISEIEELKEGHGAPRGVYWTSKGYVFFELEDAS